MLTAGVDMQMTHVRNSYFPYKRGKRMIVYSFHGEERQFCIVVSLFRCKNFDPATIV